MTGATAAWSLSRSPDRDSVRATVAGATPERTAGEAERGVGSAEAVDLDAALRRARNGDERGFRELWAALQPRLLRYLAVKAPGFAEDVAAETWLHVVRDLSRFRGDADDFRAWLFTVARNRAIDAARASSARPVVLLPELPDAATSTGSAETQALERLSTQDALRLVATLPPDQAELVALRVIAGLDVAAVAAITGRSSGAVRVGVHRALRTLSLRVESPRTQVEVP
jgi:RNA polymerase sigma-70 factor (ECF subfamily)